MRIINAGRMSLWRDPYGRDLADATANYPLATSTAAVMPVAGAPSVVIRNGSRQNHITSPAIQQDRQLQWRFYSPQEKTGGAMLQSQVVFSGVARNL